MTVAQLTKFVQTYRELKGFDNKVLLDKIVEEAKELSTSTDFENFQDELADVLITTLGLVALNDLDAVEIVINKMRKDRDR